MARPHVGLRLERRWGAIRVAAVTPNSPADRAGIVVGDVLVSIDGVATADRDPDAAETLLQGEAESEVLLIIRHERWQRVERLKRATLP